MYGENFANRRLVNPSQAAFVENAWQTGAIGEPAATLGYFFRTNYKFRDRYLLGFTVNRDGSSRFGSNKRFGTFPAVSAGWIVSDEKFMQQYTFINLLKIRGSFGLTGNAQGIANTTSIATWASQQNAGGYMGSATANPNRPANKNLRWEKGVKFDAGIDISLFNNRLEATAEVYHYTTNDMLMLVPTGTTFGYGAPSPDITWWENRGSLVNKGLSSLQFHQYHSQRFFLENHFQYQLQQNVYRRPGWLITRNHLWRQRRCAIACRPPGTALLPDRVGRC